MSASKEAKSLIVVTIFVQCLLLSTVVLMLRPSLFLSVLSNELEITAFWMLVLWL